MNMFKFHGDPGEISKPSLEFEGMTRKFISERWMEGGRKFTYRSESRIFHRRVTVLCRDSSVSIVTRRRDARPAHSFSTASKPSLANPISDGRRGAGVSNCPLTSKYAYTCVHQTSVKTDTARRARKYEVMSFFRFLFISLLFNPSIAIPASGHNSYNYFQSSLLPYTVSSPCFAFFSILYSIFPFYSLLHFSIFHSLFNYFLIPCFHYQFLSV
jgi:hypothetical protein